VGLSILGGTTHPPNPAPERRGGGKVGGAEARLVGSNGAGIQVMGLRSSKASPRPTCGAKAMDRHLLRGRYGFAG
jgi:hypothetical protein